MTVIIEKQLLSLGAAFLIVFTVLYKKRYTKTYGGKQDSDHNTHKVSSLTTTHSRENTHFRMF